jgi:hypothetical protein
MLEVVGAGLGRTGTASLKLALERLTGGRCYHMSEAIERPQDTAAWASALRGDLAPVEQVLRDYRAAIDWPAAAFWRELAAAHPDAVVLLSLRESPETWWRSVEATIFSNLQRPVPPEDRDWWERRQMVLELMATRLTPDWASREAAIAAYERHAEEVRAAIPPERLLEWRPGDGWEPLCRALGRPVPDEPFPHENRRAEFRGRAGLDQASEA